jgi:hypothetical protein
MRGARFEDTNHFLLDCPIYTESRILKHKLNWIPNLTSEILLNGSPELHSDLNVQIVKAVHSYILATKRAL